MRRFLGVPYPIRKTAQGFLYSESGVNQIKADMLILLLTNPRERVMDPFFGTPLRQLLFDPNDARLRERAKNMIVNSIKRYEPRIAVQQIDVRNRLDEGSVNRDDDGTALEQVLSIKIIFVDPENIAEVQELKLEIPLSGV